MNQIEKNILNFITKGNTSLQINEEEDLFKAGYLDSMNVLELIALIEDNTGKEFDPENVSVANLATLSKIYAIANSLT